MTICNIGNEEKMYYSEELVEEVRMKNDIVDVVSGYVKLQKKGSSHWGLCPFHNEKSPSFSVSGNKQMYHCFGCGAGGNVFTFIMNYENYSFPEAVKMLADRAGVALPEMDGAVALVLEHFWKNLMLRVVRFLTHHGKVLVYSILYHRHVSPVFLVASYVGVAGMLTGHDGSTRRG